MLPLPRITVALDVHSAYRVLRMVLFINPSMLSHECRTAWVGSDRLHTYVCTGALMTQAQLLFDEAAGSCCPEQLSSPVLHKVLAYAAIAEHIWGGKGVGSQVGCPTEMATLNDRCCTERIRQTFEPSSQINLNRYLH